MSPNGLVQLGCDADVLGAHGLEGKFADGLDALGRPLLELDIVHSLVQMDLDGRCQAASRSTAGRLTVYSRVMTSLNAERCFLSFFWGFVDSAIGAGVQREVARDKIQVRTAKNHGTCGYGIIVPTMGDVCAF
jgi:hypothetical protein